MTDFGSWIPEFGVADSSVHTGTRSDLLEELAALLGYPDEETETHLCTCLSVLRNQLPEAAELLAAWQAYMSDHPLEHVQELYTQTFDLNPVCTLDVGHYLFGEDYQRGVFLAHLRGSLEEAGLEESGELPDHLPVVLRWLARVPGTEMHKDMVTECVLPALCKMHECLADGSNPYKSVLRTVTLVLERSLTEPELVQP